MSRSDDWLKLINKRAAMKEQFPTLAKVLRERPGSAQDRENRASFEIENRVSLERSRMVRKLRADQLRDADRFIADMEQRKREQFLEELAQRRMRREAS